MGSPANYRLLQWCPQSKHQLFLSAAQPVAIDNQEQIQDLCRMAYSSYKQEEVANIQWKLLMFAVDEQGKSTMLEADSTLTFIKVGSLIYRAEGLKQKFEKWGLKAFN